jgi:hypothetical protein
MPVNFRFWPISEMGERLQLTRGPSHCLPAGSHISAAQTSRHRRPRSGLANSRDNFEPQDSHSKYRDSPGAKTAALRNCSEGCGLFATDEPMRVLQSMQGFSAFIAGLRLHTAHGPAVASIRLPPTSRRRGGSPSSVNRLRRRD